MAVKDIVKEGAPLLIKPSVAVGKMPPSELKALIRDMKDTMLAREGVGIAAPQIGVNLRVIMFGFEENNRYPGEKPVPFTVLINPWFEALDETKEDGWEGCLSIPGVRGLVSRYKAIRYGGHDAEGRAVEAEASGFHARIVQHEYDHLEGVLFTMRVEDKANLRFENQEPQSNPTD
ncbi:MAG: peptide deformylase [Bdellovibrionales bacterium]